MGTWIIVLGAVALNLWLGYNYARSKLPLKLQAKKERHKKRWPSLSWDEHGDKEDLMFWVALTTMFPFFMIPADWFGEHIKKMMDDE